MLTQYRAGAFKGTKPDDAFFVLYGDSFLPIDFGAVERDFVASGKPSGS